MGFLGGGRVSAAPVFAFEDAAVKERGHGVGGVERGMV